MTGACEPYNLGGSATTSEMKTCEVLESKDLCIKAILEAKA
jgi:hypothetical protein